MEQPKIFAATLLLAALLLLPATPALAAPAGDLEPERLSLDRAPTSWLSDLLLEIGSGVTGFWQELGNGMDPNGEPAADSWEELPEPETQLGHGIDPNG